MVLIEGVGWDWGLTSDFAFVFEVFRGNFIFGYRDSVEAGFAGDSDLRPDDMGAAKMGTRICAYSKYGPPAQLKSTNAWKLHGVSLLCCAAHDCFAGKEFVGFFEFFGVVLSPIFE